jgi:hypothetical protein
MPLFASWRHPPMPPSALARKGAQSSGSTTTTTTQYVFSSSSTPAIEAQLVLLHAQQRSDGVKNVQAEIDRYLFACVSSAFSHLVLPRNNVPHYDNLPDISHYALGILDPTMDANPELQQVLLLLRQCTPLRRRTKRAQREVQWRMDSIAAMQTLLRCIQGTLLGLYPNCLKAIAFGARVAIIRFLRSLLVQDFRVMHMCMQRIRYITKLCIMEHLCNTIYDYHPGICHTLNCSGQKIEHFCNSVSSICDIFRGELNTMYCAGGDTNVEGLDRILTILPQMERMAHSYFERCTRAYRGIIIGHTPTLRNIDHARRLSKAPQVFETLYQYLPLIHAASTQSIFELAHPAIPSHLLDLLWYITQIVSVHQLPVCVVQKQLEALSNRYHGDTTCINRCRLLHVCVQCVIRKGNAQGMLLRHDCNTNEHMCVQCGPGSVLVLDMLGRIATIGTDVLVLSSCCGSFIHYTGSGIEFSTTCGPQCVHNVHLSKRRERKQRSHGHASSSSCCMCRQRNTVQTFNLLDVPTRSVLPYSVCSRHRVPAHILKTIKDRKALELFFKIQRITSLAKP